MADRAWNALDCYAYGLTLHEQKFPVEPEEYARRRSAIERLLDAPRSG
jgi:hypothetical protein